jgi:hypothetical protein
MNTSLNPLRTSPLDLIKARLENDHWPIPPAAKQASINLLMETILGLSDGEEPLDIKVRLRAIKILIGIDTLNARREAIQVSREPKGVIHYQNLPTAELVAKLTEGLVALGLPADALASLISPAPGSPGSPPNQKLIEGEFK